MKDKPTLPIMIRSGYIPSYSSPPPTPGRHASPPPHSPKPLYGSPISRDQTTPSPEHELKHEDAISASGQPVSPSHRSTQIVVFKYIQLISFETSYMLFLS